MCPHFAHSYTPCTLTETTSVIVETVTFATEAETWLKPRDRDFIKNPETETSRFVHFVDIFKKM